VKIGPVLPFHSPSTEPTELYFSLVKRMSISGVQSKFSLRIMHGKLALTTAGGQYILKPVPTGLFRELDQVPANEHLTMQIARQVFGITVPPNAFIRFIDCHPGYLVKRFDVHPDGTRYLQEDFAQAGGMSEVTHGKDYKYDFSYEEIGALIRKHIPMHRVELEKFFRLVVFNYLFSNGDAHVRNFSMMRSGAGDQVLTPAYDLLCTRIHAPGESDMALTLFRDGFSAEFEKIGFCTRADFRLFGKKLGIREQRVERIITDMTSKQEQVQLLTERSFLRDDLKALYLVHYRDKLGRMK
ncbi:MAG: HipA domain-containing protein, partial [Bacteroidota bacterium]